MKDIRLQSEELRKNVGLALQDPLYYETYQVQYRHVPRS